MSDYIFLDENCFERDLNVFNPVGQEGEIPEYYEYIELDATIYTPRKTCAMEYGETYKVKECRVWFCSECGSPIYNDIKPYYCLYCGCKVGQ